MKSVKVTLREKGISKGRKSLYLDFYPAIPHPLSGKPTRREFLGIYILAKPRTSQERQENKSKKSLADSIRSKRHQEILEGIYSYQPNAKKKESFTDFFRRAVDQRYSTESTYKNWLGAYKQFVTCFPENVTMGDLTVEKLEEYKTYLQNSKLSPNSQNSYFSRFKTAVKEAYKKGYLPENYADRVSKIRGKSAKREFLTLEELKILAQEKCDYPVIKQAFLFSCLTGLRFIDCKNLKWRDLQGNDESGYFIRYKQQKTQSEETLPISLSARKLLGEGQESNTSVFGGLKYSSSTNIKLKEWVLLAGIRKRITFHCARHTFATLQITEGTDIYTVSKLLGHKDVGTTQVYAKIVDSKKTEAMNRLDGII